MIVLRYTDGSRGEFMLTEDEQGLPCLSGKHGQQYDLQSVLKYLPWRIVEASEDEWRRLEALGVSRVVQ